MGGDAILGATSLPSEEGSKSIFIFRQEPYKAYPRQGRRMISLAHSFL